MFGRKLKTYNIFINPENLDSLEEVYLIKEGWSWPATLLNFIWTFKHRLWKISGILVVLNIIMFYCDRVLEVSIGVDIVLNLGLAIFVGANGNDWLSNDLKQRGYNFLGVVLGTNETDAKLRFLDNRAQYIKEAKPELR